MPDKAQLEEMQRTSRGDRRDREVAERAEGLLDVEPTTLDDLVALMDEQSRRR